MNTDHAIDIARKLLVELKLAESTTQIDICEDETLRVRMRDGSSVFWELFSDINEAREWILEHFYDMNHAIGESITIHARDGIWVVNND